nr:hypothetical protein [Tanacetum cinerariifolium]
HILTAVSSKLMLFGLEERCYSLNAARSQAFVSIKKSNDVMKLQSLIDRKKVIITEDTIRQNLRLDDADGIDCLPNEEIFAELAWMGYEKPSTKLTFYKAFFSDQWKFLIHMIVQCMSAKRTAWKEFSSSIASAVICLATGGKFNFSKYIFDNLVRNVDSPSKFLMYPRFLQVMINAQVDDLSSHNTKYISPALTQKVFVNMRRIGKGFSGVETPLFDAMLVQQQVQDDAEVKEDEDNGVSVAPTPPSPTPATTSPLQQEPISSPPQTQSTQPSSPPQQQPSQTTNISEPLMTLLNKPMETCATLTKKVANLEQDKVAQALEIIKLKQRVRKLEKKRRTKHSGLKRRMHPNEDVTLVNVDSKVEIDASIQGRIEESQDKAYNLDLQHSEKVLNMQDTDEAEPSEVEEVLEVVTAAKLMTEYSAATRIFGGVTENQDNVVMRYQALKRKPVTEALARKNMMIYLKNIAGFKMDFFKRMTYNEIRPIFKKHYNSIQAFLEKEEEEEAEELKRHLQIMVNDDDDVFTEATPLASKVPIVDYQIHHENNKTYYKIIRADGTHKLFLSFITLLKNFDREDLHTLWKLVKERFESTDPKNFLDDFYLNTLNIMFEKPNVKANIWRDQKSRYGLAKVKRWKLFESCRVYIITLTTTQMILLVEKKYPLTTFSLEQMLNNMRLEVEEESKMSLELLRLVRRQLNEGYVPE